MPTVPIASALEHVSLQGDRGVTEGRSRPEVHHAAERAREGLDMDGVHTVRGEQLSAGPELDVEGGISEPFPPACALDHTSREGVAPAQPFGSASEVAVGDGATDGGGGDGCAVGAEHRRNDFHRETEATPDHPQGFDIARSTATEAVIVSDEQLLHVMPLDQDSL